MIKYVTGTPGSGKSYLGVYTLYANFGINKHNLKKQYTKEHLYPKIEQAYTNINEIKLDEFKDVEYLNFKNEDKESIEDDIYLLIVEAYELQVVQRKTDTEIKEALKGRKFFNTLFILDECHNFLDTDDKILVWWFSYHRHFNQEMYLLTQNLSLVKPKYKKFTEFFYQAVPSSLKLNSKWFKYKHYVGARMFQKEKVGTLKVPFVQEVFNTYHSGDNLQAKKVVSKFIFIMIGAGFGFICLILFIKFLWSNTSEDTRVEQIQEVAQISLNAPTTISEPTPLIENTVRKIFTCNRPKNICFVENTAFLYEEYKYFKKTYDFITIATIQLPNTNFVNYHHLVAPEFVSNYITIKVDENQSQEENQEDEGFSLF